MISINNFNNGHVKFKISKKMLILAPILLLFHFIFINIFYPIIHTQAAIIGAFLVGIYTWNTNIKYGLIYTLLSSVVTSSTFFLITGDDVFNPVVFMGITSYILVSIISAYISYMHFSLKETKKLLEEENKKTELLLANILPVSIAKRLKNGETLIADKYIDSTILFCDLVGFTKYFKNHTPVEMITILDELISAFDMLSSSLGLEKIKTIGDAYLVVSGLPDEREDHAHAIADMAIAMLDTVHKFNDKMSIPLQVRIGIHSGPVIGGVIGTKKFTFDIWGDTVNLASRMESHGVPGKIQVSKETYNLLKDDFNLEPRGLIKIKNLEQVETWFLLGEI
ncbi:MAG: hypothetical protein OCD02_05065 [Spirochaetaceae bacterium]